MLKYPAPSMPRRVLMTTDTLGGVWTYCLELSRALGEYNIEIALATMGAPLRCEQRKEVMQLPNVQVFESDYKLEWMEDPWQEVSRAGEWLLNLEENIRPDIVHLNEYAHGALPWRAPKVMVGHSCVLSWWMAVKGETAPATWDRYKYEVARGLHAADLVIAPSKAMLSDLNRYYGPLPHGSVIPNGRDSSPFLPGKKTEFVLTVGRLWDEGKNVAAIESIAPYISWPVYVAGDERHPDRGTVQISGVHFLGCLSSQALSPWFAQASIYALPARYEPFGLSALEAGLAGCALVLGDILSLREVWEGSAIFVPPNDREILKRTLEELIMDTTRRKALAAAARLRALEFTPQRMAAGYLAVYSKLMKSMKQSKEEAYCV